MLHRLAVGIAALFSCCILVPAPPSHAQEPAAPPKTVVKIELWLFELDVAKLRRLDLTSEQLGPDGQSETVKIIDVLEGKEKRSPILQRPDDLLTLLRNAGVARVLCEPIFATLGGRKASLAVGGTNHGTRIDATPTVKEDGQIQLDIRAEYNEPMPATGRRNPPGKKQSVIDTSVMIAPGKVGILPPLDQVQMIDPSGKPSSPPPLMPFALFRATIHKSGDTIGTVRTAGAIDVERK
jgi:hypothetical protein